MSDKSKPSENKQAVPKSDKPRTERGPEPERLKIQGNWKDAVKTALQKPKPPGGWPK